MFDEYEKANENVKNLPMEERNRHVFCIGRAYCRKVCEKVFAYSKEGFIAHLEDYAKHCVYHRALREYMYELYGNVIREEKQRKSYPSVPSSISVRNGSPKSVQSKKRAATVVSDTTRNEGTKSADNEKVEKKARSSTVIKKRVPPEYMKRKEENDKKRAHLKIYEQGKVTPGMFLPEDVIRYIMSYDEEKEDIRGMQKSLDVDGWVDALNGEDTSKLLEYQSSNSSNLRDYAEAYHANVKVLDFNGSLETTLKFLESRFKELSEFECSRYDEEESDSDSDDDYVDAMSDNSQGLSGKAYARYKEAEKFRWKL